MTTAKIFVTDQRPRPAKKPESKSAISIVFESANDFEDCRKTPFAEGEEQERLSYHQPREVLHATD